MLMALGLFVFGLNTAPFDSVKRSTAQRWEVRNRVGGNPAHQWAGRGDDTMTIDGVLMPELTGGPSNLDTLRAMADSGKAWILTAGDGTIRGKWFIDSVEETRTGFLTNGAARKIEFSLTLRRYWDDTADQLGDLMDSLP